MAGPLVGSDGSTQIGLMGCVVLTGTGECGHGDDRSRNQPLGAALRAGEPAARPLIW